MNASIKVCASENRIRAALRQICIYQDGSVYDESTKERFVHEFWKIYAEGLADLPEIKEAI